MGLSAGTFMDLGSMKQQRIDYDVRTDENPVYIGYADRGLATSDKKWNIQKFTYDGSGRVTVKQVAGNVAWDDRATSTYA